MSEPLKAPFSYFGNKRLIAQAIWERLGSVDTYIETCFGSGAVYFARQNPRGTEIVNDKEGFLVNTFRAITYYPDEVANLVVYPPSELDIIARHRWLMEIGKPKLELLRTDPIYCDPQIAAWYIYGAACFVGNGWCLRESYKNQKLKIPKASDEGVFRTEFDGEVEKVKAYFRQISYRMRNTKIACGDWDRVVTPAWTTGDIVGIFADPPYEDSQHSVQYSAGGYVAQAVRAWAIENGDNPRFRIAISGYDSENYRFPDTWETLEWKASGGYGNQAEGKGRENARRERIWFSPACLKPGLFHYTSEDSLEPEKPLLEPPIRQEIPIILSKENSKRQPSLFDLME